MNKNDKRILIGSFFIAVIIAILFFYIPWTDSNLEYALSHFKGKDIQVPMWLSAIVAIVANFIGLIFNLICFLLKLQKTFLKTMI